MTIKWSDLLRIVLLIWVAPTAMRSASPLLPDAGIIQGCRGGPSTEKAITQDRMPQIPTDKLTEAQMKAADEFAAGRGTPVFGPFVPLLRSPEVMQPAEVMGEYLQFKTVLPPKLREFVILITARQWTQETEWNSHVSIAVKDGLSRITCSSRNGVWYTGTCSLSGSKNRSCDFGYASLPTATA